jgi:hypothetical protein
MAVGIPEETPSPIFSSHKFRNAPPSVEVLSYASLHAEPTQRHLRPNEVAGARAAQPMSASQVAKGGSAIAAEAEGGVEAMVRDTTGGMLGLWRNGCEGARVRRSEGPRVRGGQC